MQEQEIKELYDQWRKAMMTNDLVFLKQLFSKDFTAITNVIKCKNRDEELLWLGVRNVKYLLWEDKNLLIDADDNSGFLKCTQSLKVLVYDLPAKIDREITLSFIKQDKTWQLKQFKENAVRFT